jgi:hypothetical protein
MQSLNEVYLIVLREEAPADDPISREEVLLILNAIVTALDPLSIDAIKELLDVDTAEVVAKRLGSVLHFSGSQTDLVQILHVTFHEFLTNVYVCNDPSFCVDSKDMHKQFSKACFRTLQSLQQNMCSSKDTSLLNSELPRG